MAILQGNNWTPSKTKLLFGLANKFWPGFLAGLLYFSYVFWWFWSLYPLDSLGIRNKIAAAAIISIVFFACIIVMAVWWGVASWFGAKFIGNGRTNILTPAILASIFTLTEYFRSIFFSIFWYGSGGAIGPYWPLGNLAYLAVNVEPLASTAGWWGIYGIEFLIIFFASCLILIYFKKEHRKNYIFQLIGLATIITALGSVNAYLSKHTEKLPPISIAIIQTKTPSAGFTSTEEYLEDLHQKLNLTEEAAGKIGEGIIIFPEGTNFSSSLSKLLDMRGLENYFNNLSEKGLLIIDSLRVSDENTKFRSRATLVDSKNGLIGSYDKEILTPGGEFLPYIIKFPLTLFNSTLRKQFEQYIEYEPGSGINTFSYKNTGGRVLICSELISPTKINQNNADFNIIIGSFSIWSGSRHATDQSLFMARFRAIESGKYTVLASNFGRSYILNPSGKIEVSTETNGYELLTGTIIPNKNRTWYNYLGDWPILLLSSAFFAVGVRRSKFM